MARWKDKVHRTSKNKAQSTRQGSTFTHQCEASTQDQRTGAEAGNMWYGPVRQGFLKVENFRADSGIQEVRKCGEQEE